MKTKHIVVKVTEVFKKRVKKAAERDNKTLSSYVRDCLLEDFKRKGKNEIDEK